MGYGSSDRQPTHSGPIRNGFTELGLAEQGPAGCGSVNQTVGARQALSRRAAEEKGRGEGRGQSWR